MIGQMVVVTTDRDRRGVFFGQLIKYDGDVVELANARNAVYWSKETKGFLGLAAMGPADGSRISDPVPLVYLNGVTSITIATEAACKRWEAGPWT